MLHYEENACPSPSHQGKSIAMAKDKETLQTNQVNTAEALKHGALQRMELSDFTPKQRILAAALKLFVEQGYFRTNVPDLSRDSKCSVGSIYHNFKNKEEVARELYTEGISAFRSALYQALYQVNDVELFTKKLIVSFLHFSEANHQLSKYLWLCRHNEFMTGIIRHPTRVGFDPLGRKLTKTIRRGIKEGRIRPLKANIIWSILFGIPVGYVRDWLDGYNDESPKLVADIIADSCWRALKMD
jgi:AcrR family transcriptional regulator